MQRGDTDVVRVSVCIPIAFSVFFAILCSGMGSMNAGEYKVDGSVIEKYAGSISIIKNAEATISILESLVGQKVRSSKSKWSCNLFYPAVKVIVPEGNKPSGGPVFKNKAGLESKLIGVVVGRMGSFAIFADKLVKEGERYGEIKVVRVDIDRVVIETRDGLKELIVQ